MIYGLWTMGHGPWTRQHRFSIKYITENKQSKQNKQDLRDLLLTVLFRQEVSYITLRTNSNAIDWVVPEKA